MVHRRAAVLLVAALCCSVNCAYSAADPSGRSLATPAASDAPTGCTVVFQTNSSQAAFTLCPGTKVFSAVITYVPSASVTSVAFTAVAINTAEGPGADPNVACTVSSSAIGSARVNCTRNDGTAFPPNASYKVQLTASASCGSSPSTSVSFSVSFVVKDGPRITIQQQGPAKPFVCSDVTTVLVNYNFTVTADTSSGQIILGGQQQRKLAAAAASIAGTSCSAKVFPGPQTTVGNMYVVTGSATVTCQGTLTKPPSALDLNLVLTARLEGCAPVVGLAKTRVLVLCCKQGRTYARQRRVGARRTKCFRHYLPGTTSGDCSTASPVFGLYNQGPATAKLALFDGNTTKCATQATVGTAAMTCDSSNNKLANFKVQSLNRDLAAEQEFLLSCAPPSTTPGTCPGNLQWQDARAMGMDATVKLIDRNNVTSKVTTFSAALPTGSSCDCKDAVWAVYESGVFTGLPADQCS